MTQSGGITPTHSAAMSEEQLKAFLEAVKADEALQEKLKAAADTDAVVEIAKAAGFAISAEELKKSQAEISEEELEGVAGGFPLAVQRLLRAFYSKVSLILKSPCIDRSFYCFNRLTNPINQPSIPGTIACI